MLDSLSEQLGEFCKLYRIKSPLSSLDFRVARLAHTDSFAGHFLAGSGLLPCRSEAPEHSLVGAAVSRHHLLRLAFDLQLVQNGLRVTALSGVRDGLLSDDPYRFSTALATVLRAALEEKLIGFDHAAHVDGLAKAAKHREALAALVLCFAARHEWPPANGPV